jgi:outer membrane protein assembly factor BamE (lipoprotein component of BamABCDE complex)
MTIIKRVSACAVVISLAACASSGNGQIRTLSQDGAAATLVRGKTVREEVRRELGDAVVTEFPSGQEIWVYQFTDSAAKFVKYVPLLGRLTSSGSKIKELKILFGKDGIVKKYQLQDIRTQ